MSTPSQHRKRSTRQRGSPPVARRAEPASGFLAAWAQRVPDWAPSPPHRRGRKPRVSIRQLAEALTFHVMQGAGTLAEHFYEVFEEPLADSSWSDRRRRLPWEIFADLMRRALRPLATRRQQPDAFWRRWRLLALDGTQYSLTNTPQVTASATKAQARRGRAAFAKMGVAVLLELGLHNPLAAAIARQGDSELALARRLFAQLPKGVLLLADRLYGVPAVIVEVWAACRRVHSQFLFRMPRHITARVLTKLPDGSRRIRVAVREPGRPWKIASWLEMREIRVQAGRKGFRRHELRLCTSLLDHRQAPALELAALYAARWEHELYFREAKRVLRQTDLLQSHTVETGAQEIAAIMLATALLARERMRAANGQVPVLRIKFGVVLAVVRSTWFYLGYCDDLLTARQQDQIVRRGQQIMRYCVTAKRRARSCPRAVRQPIRGWPRLQKTHSMTGPVQLKIV
ncbi:MAG: IS4 family transposase [Gemmatimonadetes bacterium]|nr:IS4 family transposase [Gemmatimonadota bacterium]